MLRTNCPGCSRAVVVYPTWVGTQTECPHCHHSFTVPAHLAEEAPAEVVAQFERFFG